jgi:RNA polymerase sigma-70 factor (ECF subfamily)
MLVNWNPFRSGRCGIFSLLAQLFRRVKSHLMSVWSDDSALVERCKRELPHQHAAFSELVKRYKNMVFTLCYRVVGEAAYAEDLMQEVFTKVFLNLKDFEGRSAFSSWLYRITHNHCLNFLAKQNREQAGLAGYAEDQNLQHAHASGNSAVEPMQEVLNQLDEEPRSILIMKYVLELDLAEIGAILGITLSAVKMRLLRAREEFRIAYENLGNVGEKS